MLDEIKEALKDKLTGATIYAVEERDDSITLKVVCPELIPDRIKMEFVEAMESVPVIGKLKKSVHLKIVTSI